MCHSPVSGDGNRRQGSDQCRGEGWTGCSYRCGELTTRHSIVDKQGQGLGVGITGSDSNSDSGSTGGSDGCWLIG